MLIIVCLGDLWINEACVFTFYEDQTLKLKIKHRYSYTSLALMG